MRPLFSGLFVFLFAQLCVAQPPACTADESKTCLCGSSFSRRRDSGAHLFARDLDKCSDGTDPCCTARGPGPPQVSSGTFDLQCGSNFGDDSQDITGGVTYDIRDCPTGTEKCLHVKFSPASGDVITDIHLQLSSDTSALTNKALGTWAFNKYCSATSGECFVPLPAVPGGPDLCDGDILYAAAGISVNVPGSTNSPTCFNKGTTIGPGNWFMFVTLQFSCPDICVKGCCCPATPPQICDLGTAYAQSSHDLKTDGICGHWGWYFPDVTTGFGPVPLILGQNTPVGTVSVTIDADNTLHWVYDVPAPNGIIEAHAEILCAPPDCSGRGPCTPNVCAPGQFTDNSGCLGGQPRHRLER